MTRHTKDHAPCGDCGEPQYPCDECGNPVCSAGRHWDGVSDMWVCGDCWEAEYNGGPLASWWTPEIEARRHANPRLWLKGGER